MRRGLTWLYRPLIKVKNCKRLSSLVLSSPGLKVMNNPGRIAEVVTFHKHDKNVGIWGGNNAQRIVHTLDGRERLTDVINLAALITTHTVLLGESSPLYCLTHSGVPNFEIHARVVCGCPVDVPCRMSERASGGDGFFLWRR